MQLVKSLATQATAKRLSARVRLTSTVPLENPPPFQRHDRPGALQVLGRVKGRIRETGRQGWGLERSWCAAITRLGIVVCNNTTTGRYFKLVDCLFPTAELDLELWNLPKGRR